MIKYFLKHILIPTFLVFFIYCNGYSQNSTRPRDVKGWADTTWGMNKTQLQKKVVGKLEDISNKYEQNPEWKKSPVIPMLQLKKMQIGDALYDTLFLFSKDDQQLHGVEIVSTTNSVETQAALFQDLRDKLVAKYGRSDDHKLWKQTKTESDHHYDHQVIWNFTSTMILLRFQEMKRGMEHQATNENLKVEYIDQKYYRKERDETDKL